MPNNYFKFKQFTIHQDKCAMKVCTDACLFGAIVADSRQAAAICLDIGTGTGLLSLMVAQKNPLSIIDAVEINAVAAEQAKENISASPWAGRIRVINEDVLAFDPGKQYDCIISNPPFFEDDLQSPDAAKNNAKHSTALNLIQLLNFVDTHLASAGFFSILLPFHRVEYFTEEAKKTGLYVTKKILVKQNMEHQFFRAILFFTRRETEMQISEILIKDTENNYTAEFTALLKDYYLFL
jgi:tRNA1Val (adenine37-N6)-methyltransferase